VQCRIEKTSIPGPKGGKFAGKEPVRFVWLTMIDLESLPCLNIMWNE